MLSLPGGFVLNPSNGWLSTDFACHHSEGWLSIKQQLSTISYLLCSEVHTSYQCLLSCCCLLVAQRPSKMPVCPRDGYA